MNWLQKINQSIQTSYDVRDIIQGIAIGSFDITWAKNQLSQMIAQQGNSVCDDIVQIIPSFPQAKSATDSIMRHCCPGTMIPVSQNPQIEQTQPINMPQITDQEKPMEMSSVEIT